jgi:hypothetical protein
MPRLSLYRPEKGNDFRFLDRQIEEQFQVGGIDIFVHRYAGPVDPATLNPDNTPSTAGSTNTVTPELSIQDVILMENRDRHYDPNIYIMRGIYQMQDLDFNLSQFGIFLNNDNIFMHFHLRNCVETLGRKIMAGDVLELPHLKDEYALDNSATMALKRFYVVQDVTRASNGFSQTWYPHLLRVKCVPLVDSQEYAEIFDQIQTDSQGNATGSTLRDLISTYNRNIEINEQIVAQAELDAPLSGYDTHQMYELPLDSNGQIMIQDTSLDTHIPDTSWDWTDTSGAVPSLTAPTDPAMGDKWLDTNNIESPELKIWNGHFWQGNTVDASSMYKSPTKDLYVGYLTGDGRPPNGAPYSFGISFPAQAIEGQFHLRTDYMPNRLFRYNGQHWMKYEDNVRMTMTNTPSNGNQDTPNSQTRQTQRTSFINNTTTATIAGKIVQERQALSKVLKPKADN